MKNQEYLAIAVLITLFATLVIGCFSTPFDLLSQSATASYRAGDYEKAIADYTEAIKINPNYYYTFYMRGAAYSQIGELDRAIEDYNQSIRLSSTITFPAPYLNRGQAYHNKGDYSRAISDYETALRLNPNLADSIKSNLDLARQRQPLIQNNNQVILTQVQSGGTEIPVQTGRNEQGLAAQPPSVPVTVPGNNLADKLAWLQAFVQSNGNYILEVDTNESIGPQSISYSGRNNVTITLIGVDSNKTISLSSNGSMFTIGSGVTMVLDNNITLQGIISIIGSSSLVMVNNGGTLRMNDGVVITGNAYNGSTGGGGGGVSVEGVFIMNGGVITKNGSLNRNGGGVSVRRGATFTMNGGVITENRVSSSPGGGVLVEGTFIMNSGTISGNSASRGGGVYGTITMNGGTISGNTAVMGGGVYGSITMRGGNISGNSAINNNSISGTAAGGGVYATDPSSTSIIINGTISGNTTQGAGGGVYLSYSTFEINGGTISNNSARDRGGGDFQSGGTFTMQGGSITANTAINNGGGVAIDQGTFTKTGGTITGYTSDRDTGNTVKDNSGSILNYRGHAVYAGSTNTLLKIRESTAGLADNLSFSYTGTSTPATASGAWDN